MEGGTGVLGRSGILGLSPLLRGLCCSASALPITAACLNLFSIDLALSLQLFSVTSVGTASAVLLLNRALTCN